MVFGWLKDIKERNNEIRKLYNEKIQCLEEQIDNFEKDIELYGIDKMDSKRFIWDICCEAINQDMDKKRKRVLGKEFLEDYKATAEILVYTELYYHRVH